MGSVAGLSVALLTGQAAVLTVGPSGTYAKPCLAIRHAHAGDTIQIDAAGSYSGDVCRWLTNNLTLIGVNGRPHVDAAGRNASGKGIWVIDGNGTVVENMEFSGATAPDGNGAGIRHEGVGLTVRNSYFHHNQNGVFSTATGGAVWIEYSEFAYNGSGSGHTHNMYIGHVDTFTLRYSYSHHANIGHLVKSRAGTSYILYNRLTDEAGGQASYELDLPNGGTSYVIGNVIEQSRTTTNSTIMSYGEEGIAPPVVSQDLYVVNNTFVNDATGGMFIQVDPSVAPAAVLTNNIFSGPGTLTNQNGALLTGNIIAGNAHFADAADYDYHLLAASPAIGAGASPGYSSENVSLAAVEQYVHSECAQGRGNTNDSGAMEYRSAMVGVTCSSQSPAVSNVTATLVISTRSVKGGNSVGATVFLNQPAPPDGVQLAFSSPSACINVPDSVTVPAGQSSVSFTLATQPVTSVTTAVLEVNAAGGEGQAVLTVTP